MKKKKVTVIVMATLVLMAGAAAYYIIQSKKEMVAHERMDGMSMPEEKEHGSMEGMDIKEESNSMDTMEMKNHTGMEGMNMGDGSDNTGADIPHDFVLHTLMQPTNSYVITSIPVTSPRQGNEEVNVELLGFTVYNTSSIGSVAARITGRIEKLYVQYRFQKIKKGQKIMEIYSPELLTAQQNLLFLLKSDERNASLIEAAKQRLLLLGFPPGEMQQVIKTGRPLFTVTVYSNYSGHIHETSKSVMTSEPAGGGAMGASQPQQLTTQELAVKEGMYVQKGQSVFLVYDPDKLWALLNIYPSESPFVKVGETVSIKPEGFQNKNFEGTIYFVEPFLRPGNRTVTARVNIANQELKLPVGAQLRATLLNASYKGIWLPRASVLSLGVDKVVFIKVKGGFKVEKIETGVTTSTMIQVVGGLSPADSVAANAQYLVDSESFIKINQ